MLQWRSVRPVSASAVSIAFGHVIRELRLGAELSQEALSFKAGRHRTYVSAIERGQSAPTVDTLWVLAESLGVRPSELVSRVEARLADETKKRRRTG